LEIKSEFNDLESAPPLILDLFDKDDGFFDKKDDFMGRAFIFLDLIDDISHDDRIPEPKWYPVVFTLNDASNVDTGPCILASFAFKEYDE
jgi:hypothetical protein